MDRDNPTTDRAIVIAGGDMTVDPCPTATTVVIAADSGYDHARRIGLGVDLLIGDLDSISASGLAHARDTGVEIVQHAEDKDHTDLELAMDHAARAGATRIAIHGGEAGSLGHLLGVALELTDRRWADIEVTWHTAGGVVRIVRPDSPITLQDPPRSTVSLIPVGDVRGVTTTGLRWPLTGDDLLAGTSRGLRNAIVSHPVRISITDGALLVIVEEPEP